MQQKETLSAFMDGHKVEDDFLSALNNSAELQQKWANYHTVRSVMRGEEIMLGADFSAKMAALIEQEEIEKSVPAQATEKPRGLLVKLKRWSTPIMQAGIAASVCLVAVFGFNAMNGSSTEVVQADEPVLKTFPLSNDFQTVSYNAPTNDVASAEQLEKQQQKLNMLLQNHELQRRMLSTSAVPSEEQKVKAQTSSAETPTSVEQK